MFATYYYCRHHHHKSTTTNDGRRTQEIWRRQDELQQIRPARSHVPINCGTRRSYRIRRAIANACARSGVRRAWIVPDLAVARQRAIGANKTILVRRGMTIHETGGGVGRQGKAWRTMVALQPGPHASSSLPRTQRPPPLARAREEHASHSPQ